MKIKVADLFQINVGGRYALIRVIAIGKWAPLCELYEPTEVKQSRSNNLNLEGIQRMEVVFINLYVLQNQAVYLGQCFPVPRTSDLPPYFTGFLNECWELHFWDGRVQKMRGKNVSCVEMLSRGHFCATIFSLKQVLEFYKGIPLKRLSVRTASENTDIHKNKFDC